MAEVKEKQLNTRILLRYDTYANWINSDPILKEAFMRDIKGD